MRSLAAILLSLGFSFCYAAQHEDPPLIGAARSGDATAVTTLVKRGADPNQRAGVNGWTPLMHAIHKHQLASVAALLASGADPNASAPNRLTPLMMAAGYGYTDMVRLLLTHGASPRVTDLDEKTALDYAIEGTTDIDRFTFFDCQDETVRALRAADRSLKVGPFARRWASVKRCKSNF